MKHLIILKEEEVVKSKDQDLLLAKDTMRGAKELEVDWILDTNIMNGMIQADKIKTEETLQIDFPLLILKVLIGKVISIMMMTMKISKEKSKLITMKFLAKKVIKIENMA